MRGIKIFPHMASAFWPFLQKIHNSEHSPKKSSCMPMKGPGICKIPVMLPPWSL